MFENTRVSQEVIHAGQLRASSFTRQQGTTNIGFVERTLGVEQPFGKRIDFLQPTIESIRNEKCSSFVLGNANPDVKYWENLLTVFSSPETKPEFLFISAAQSLGHTRYRESDLLSNQSYWQGSRYLGPHTDITLSLKSLTDNYRQVESVQQAGNKQKLSYIVNFDTITPGVGELIDFELSIQLDGDNAKNLPFKIYDSDYLKTMKSRFHRHVSRRIISDQPLDFTDEVKQHNASFETAIGLNYLAQMQLVDTLEGLYTHDKTVDSFDVTVVTCPRVYAYNLFRQTPENGRYIEQSASGNSHPEIPFFNGQKTYSVFDGYLKHLYGRKWTFNPMLKPIDDALRFIHKHIPALDSES